MEDAIDLSGLLGDLAEDAELFLDLFGTKDADGKELPIAMLLCLFHMGMENARRERCSMMEWFANHWPAPNLTE